MSLLDRLNQSRDARDRDAKANVLYSYANAIHEHEEMALVLDLADMPGYVNDEMFAFRLVQRAWRAERDDPEPWL